MSTNTSSKKYVKMEPKEKDLAKAALEEDERFVSESRITMGAFLALLAQEKLESNEGEN